MDSGSAAQNVGHSSRQEDVSGYTEQQDRQTTRRREGGPSTSYNRKPKGKGYPQSNHYHDSNTERNAYFGGGRDYYNNGPFYAMNGYDQAYVEHGSEYYSQQNQRPSRNQSGNSRRRYDGNEYHTDGNREPLASGDQEQDRQRRTGSSRERRQESGDQRNWNRDMGGYGRNGYQDAYAQQRSGNQGYYYQGHQRSENKTYNRQKYHRKKSAPQPGEASVPEPSAAGNVEDVNEEHGAIDVEMRRSTARDDSMSEASSRDVPSQSYYSGRRRDLSQKEGSSRRNYYDSYSYGYERKPGKQSKTSPIVKAKAEVEILESESLPASLLNNSDLPPKTEAHKKKQTYEKQVLKVKSSDFDQREKLTEQLTSGRYECMVCCDNVKPAQAIWSCSSCFNVFHIGCIKKWAGTAATQGEEGWRCPACQTVRSKLPSGYFCFCGKVREPQWNYRDIPHSCGDLCRKALAKDGEKICDHKCNILCHPGPCPPCTAQVQRTCPCGKTTKTVKCNTDLEANFCSMKCSKVLKCGKHDCPALCHSGDCQDCEVTYEISCHCEKETRVIPCANDVDKNTRFTCENKCSKLLSCGNHRCELTCHSGKCMECPYLPNLITTCPCGKTTLEKLYELEGLKPRTSCKEPILTCGKACQKELECGPLENRHTCEEDCHNGPCPVCPKTTEVRCRCGKNDIQISCKDYKKDGLVLCERKCNKKRHCGRHKCLQTCCVDVDHLCTVVCGRLLSCGNHTCEELCHTGPCKRCLRASFEELTCHCGAAVIFPPVSCGTRPPECSQPCTRPRTCPHPPNHNCHSDLACPPCTALTERWCFGQHELRKNVLCHLTSISCGRPCGKPLPCGRHTCIRTCHDGACFTADQKCVQPCPMPRPACGHPCGSPCHEGDCPEIPCRKKVSVSCECGHRKGVVSCEDQQSAYKKIATEHLFSKMSEMNAGQSISLDSVLGSGKIDKSKSLKCDEECAQIDRNRRLALALQIRNPDLLPRPGPPNYSQFMKDWVRKDSKFVQMVHEKLSELVQLAKQSKQKSRQHSFPVMNREKRQFVHEYCEFFGCESQAFDEEPNRNVVVTAYGDKSWLPSQSLFDVCMRESGQRKIPQPPSISVTKKSAPSVKPQAPSQQASTAAATSSSFSYAKLSDVVKGEPKSTVIDYFDMTE